MKKICVYCGKQFDAKTERAKYCSSLCKDISLRIAKGISVNPNPEPLHKVCVICGNGFDTRREAQKTCSHKCAVKYENRKDYERARRKRGGLTWDEYVNKVKRQAQQNKEIKMIEKKFYVSAHTVERECAVCGELFFCLDAENRKTCSPKCSKERQRSHQGKDKRIPKEQIIDKDITLKRLFHRDEGRCWICGNVCDWNDKRISKTGYEYPGDKYPARDHVIPISRGGLHSWDNVRLACTKCNSEKSDDIYPCEKLERSFAYSEKRKGNPNKPTIQMTLGGEVVRTWESTAQIKRELGLNNKRIQEVCRGNGKTAFGYIWMYAEGVRG